MPTICRSAGTMVALTLLPGSLLLAQPISSSSGQGGFGEHLRTTQPSATSKVPRQPYPGISRPADEGSIAEIEMFVGESRVFPTPGVARIAIGNGSILTAAALDGKEVILFANGVGTSSLFVWNEAGQSQRVKINILPGDTSRISREIAAFLTAIPNARASVIGDKVIVEGDNLGDVDMARIELLSQRYPQIVNFTNPLGFERMVMLDVKVVEFPVNELRELGLRWGVVGGATIGGVWSPLRRGDAPGLQANINAPQLPVVGTGDTLGPALIPSGLNIRSGINLGLGATLQALAQEGKTAILAEPQLSARSGSRASFLAGGEIPYSVSSPDGTTILFKSYGVKLDILPQVGAGGNIRATIEAEVSNIDGSVTTQFGPALLTRKTSTEFNVRGGETIVLSGLIQREQSSNVDKVPGLGDLPVIGALFRSKRFLNRETELVVFVTPTVIGADSEVNLSRIEATERRIEHHLGTKPHIQRDGMEVPPQGFHTPSDSQRVPPDQAVQARPITLQKFERGGQATVTASRIPLLLVADVNSPVRGWLVRGQLVTLLELDARGGWTAVEVDGVRGWAASSWLDPLPASQP
jgi:pilus assembly protein CpaC